MGRENEKVHSVDYSNSIKKSNELSMAKLNQGLTLNQMQLLAFSIFSTQQDGETEFRKFEFQNKFGINNYKTKDAYDDSQRLSQLQFSTQDFKNNKFSFVNVFGSIEYIDGLFIFEWNKKVIPHILELKEKYVLTDLTITAKFRSSFSWTLYDYLKAHYGYWKIEVSKQELMRLFSVENRITYQKSTAQFKRAVLDVGINEINKYTELEVWYTEKRVGNKITDFTLYWSTGKRAAGATKKQISLLREIHDEVEKNVFKYLALKNTEDLESARINILKIKEINAQVNNQLTSTKARYLIFDAKVYYDQLQNLLKKDGQDIRDLLQFNWLEDTEK